MEGFFYRSILFDYGDIVQCGVVFVIVKMEMELHHLFHIVLDKLACADYRMF